MKYHSLYFHKMTTTWNTMAGEDCDILLTKADGSTLVLRVGECVKITRIVGRKHPVGINYLPWRGDRWANPSSYQRRYASPHLSWSQ